MGVALSRLGPGPSGWRQAIVCLLIAAWSWRLGSHLFRRARRGIDDPRYAELRQRWGASAESRMFWFAQSQALAALPLVLAVLLAAHRPGSWPDWQDLAGLLVFAAGLIGASLSDRQLSRFASDPANRNQVCDQGLWRYSRHPNYVCEWLGWVGVAIIAVDFSGVNAVGWLAVAAPVMMYVLLVYVSGIPLLEDHMVATRGAAYRAYQRRTNPFFPWLPKH